MAVQAGEIKSFLGAGTEFKGLLNFEGTVKIDGIFEGEVVAKETLVVGDRAVVSASVTIGTLIVLGKFKGNVSASKKIEIVKGGEVIGNIKTPALVVEEGALFDGKCEMLKKEAKEKDKKITVLPGAKDLGGQEEAAVS